MRQEITKIRLMMLCTMIIYAQVIRLTTRRAQKEFRSNLPLLINIRILQVLVFHLNLLWKRTLALYCCFP